jgi:glycosyltransferase involved in cell wall biosynthesis
MDAALPQAGGPGTFIALFTRRARQAGHSVLHFGCVGQAGPAEMPRFIDYTRLDGLAANTLGALRILHDPVAAGRLDAFLARRRVDVAHVHNIYHHLTPSIFPVLRRRGIPVVMSVRDYRLFCGVKAFLRRNEVCTRCLPHRYWNCVLHRCAGGRAASAAVALETFVQRFLRRYIQNVEMFLCPSRFMAKVLLADDVPANKVAVLPNPIEPPARPATTGRQKRRILYVGRLSEEKGPDLMLDVAEALPRVEVSIVGDGPEKESLEQDSRRRGLRNVVFYGHVPHAELGVHYGRASVVVLPSRCMENSPHAMLEGMVWGRCVVAPAHGPIEEWVRDGRTGRLFRPGDGADLARVVAEAMGDAAGRRRMGRAAADMVRTRHDPADIVARLLEIYGEAICRCESP